MRCTNCGASIPRGEGACPECGVFARVVAPERQSTRKWILMLLLIAAAVGATTYFLTRPARPVTPLRKIHIVRDRPGGARVGAGATISEPEAILRVQRSFRNVAPDCVATISKGYSDGAYTIEAVNRCAGTRLGRCRVDGKSGAVSR